jgi:rSAM/selenodomain-associated transferase 2
VQDDWPPEKSLSSRKKHCAESISIIIPALNEESVLASTLESTRSSLPLEVILVDGGSVDGTQEVASRYGAEILLSAPGRARQMNRGAAAASGSILLFLHADTRLPRHFDRCVCEVLSCPRVVAGAFELGIDAPTPSLRWIERMANWRSRRLHMPYGDQAIFVRGEVFRAIGGFSELPIMEDFELMLRLRKLGHIAIIPKLALTSARRWQETGILTTTLINQIAILSYFLGISPARIAHWFPGRNNRVAANTS